MLWRYAKNVLAYSLSGVFIIIALRFGAEFAKVDYIHLGERSSGSTIAALMGVIQVNLPILMTVGLVKSSEGFMSKLFA